MTMAFDLALYQEFDNVENRRTTHCYTCRTEVDRKGSPREISLKQKYVQNYFCKTVSRWNYVYTKLCINDKSKQRQINELDKQTKYTLYKHLYHKA